MRNKEEAHDYRYFPDPDLLPLELAPALVEELRANLPELPDDKKARLMRDYGLSFYDADVLAAERDTADFFEEVARGREAKLAANWVINELAGRLNKEGKGIASSPVSASQLGSILDLIAAGTISGKIAKDVFEITWNEGGDPRRAIVTARGMAQVTDLSAIETMLDAIIADNPDKVAQAKAKPALIGWFVGQVMKASRRQGQPADRERPAQAQARRLTDGGRTSNGSCSALCSSIFCRWPTAKLTPAALDAVPKCLRERRAGRITFARFARFASKSVSRSARAR